MFCLFALFAAATFRTDHAVDLSVVAPFGEVSLFDQMAAYLNTYSKTIAGEFLKKGLENNVFELDDEKLWEFASQELNEQVFSLMKANIQIGASVPRVLFNGHSEKSEKKDFVNTIYETDFVFGEPKFVFIGDLKRDSAEILQLLNANEGFVLRVAPEFSGKHLTTLKGYGVEMKPFKYSMEYGVKDSTETTEENSETISVHDSTTKSIPSIPESNLNNVSYLDFDTKLGGFLMNQERPLPEVMRDITSNWPLYVKEIDSTTEVDKSVPLIRRFFRENFETSAINGRYIPSIDMFDSFKLLDVIKEEQRLLEILKELNVTGLRRDVFLTNEPPNSNEYLVKFRSEAVDWYNNLEEDEEYKTWPFDTREFTPQGFHVRKNLVHIIHYVDPSTEEGIFPIFPVLFMLRRGMPVRFGLVPYFNFANPISRKVAFAYHHIAAKNSREAIMFLVRAWNFDMENARLSQIGEQEWADSFYESARRIGSNLKWNDLLSLASDDTVELHRIRRNTKYLKGLQIPKNSASVNGWITHVPNHPNMVSRMFHRTVFGLAEMFKSMGRKTLPPEDIDEVLNNEKPLWETYDTAFIDLGIDGLKMNKMTLDKQLGIIDSIRKIDWQGDASSACYCLIYAKENVEEIVKSLGSVRWVLNPAVDGITFSDSELPAIVMNGRVIRNANISQLPSLRKWSDFYVDRYAVDCMRSNKVECFIIGAIINDWRAQAISRTDDGLSFFRRNVESSLIYNPRNNDINFTIIMNPFSRRFQRIAGFLSFVNEQKIANLQLLLNANANATIYAHDMGSFYRSVFDKDDAIFTYLNDSTTYSAMLNVPNTWDIETLSADMDLDNILLAELPSKVHKARYIVTGLVMQGYCIDENEKPATGAIIRLGDHDTTVMKKMGYFQLPAKIGLNTLDMVSKHYKILNPEVQMNSFAVDYVTINTKTLGQEVPYVPQPSNVSRVDVFTVASGHLYERLMKIMMLSVRRNTESKVTFWILKNFLSPQFKASLPEMAEKYGFEYQLVKYNWPDWVVHQSEKQRIIWGNKILFLDELFPADLERVIYVDSDQIVRTDLHELMNMSFDGAPYAFTPFCDSRKETEPFRFWKQGSWLEHLKGKNYHISALFAIDLVEFRKRRAGDLLRQVYQSLAVDGHSLANLDQDLPNFIQHELPIYSLPQNWLWCETWCSDETMSEAKTIDLCNNPLTKTPKLEIAKTRVAEWPGLDEEVRQASKATGHDYEKIIFSE